MPDDLSQYTDAQLEEMLSGEPDTQPVGGGDFSSFSDQELEAMLGEFEPETVGSQQQGFLGGVSEDVATRATQAAAAQERRRAGEIGRPEEIFQMAGQSGLGLVGDIGGRALAAGAGAIDDLTGGAIGAGLSRVGGVVGGLPSLGGGTIGQQIPQEVAGLYGQYQEFAEESPRAAANIEAALNIGLSSPLARYGEDIIDATGKFKKGLDKSKLSKISSEDLRQKGGELFQRADEIGGGVTPEFWDDYIGEISKIKKQTELGQVLEGDDAVTQAIESLRLVQGNHQSLSAIKEADEILGDLAEGSVDAFGKYDKKGRKFLQMQMGLRDLLDKSDADKFTGGKEGFEAIKEARKYWAASRRLDEVERIIGKSADAEQPATVLKNGFRRLRDNPKKMKQYTAEEQFAIKKAAKTGSVGGFLKLAGSGLVPIVAGASGAAATGGIAGGLASIPAYGIQQAAKAGGVALQQGRAVKVPEAIRRSVLPAPPPANVLPNLGAIAAPVAAGVAPLAGAGALQETLAQRAQRVINRKRNRIN